ncbi:T cell activation RhoGTPase activating protein a [Sardina pilchardus]|uniref:T cell activation RhoGTPase activating protein a n=1 Tax=Sardina pilchardus TaxID=27697 RepID=UPI002E102EBA
MKVLSNHVSKSLSEGSMDSFIMLPSTGDVKVEHVLHAQSSKTTPGNASPTENINQKRWRNVFRRIQKKGIQTTVNLQPKSSLFGQPLSHVFVDEMTLPKPITEILLLLCKNGPCMEGVFRRAGNARVIRETKEKLNAGAQVDFSDMPVLLLAALLKDFLREIPGGLLMEELYQSWMTAMAANSVDERCEALKKVIEGLPAQNTILLRHLVSMLDHISQNAEQNKMNPRNLAVCIAPNLLRVDQVEAVEKVTNLTEFLIENYHEVFGESIQYLFGDSDEEELNDSQDSLCPPQHDSAYETDADGEKGSCVHLVSSADGKLRDRLISGTSTPAKETFHTFTKPFARRRSEPAITLPQSLRVQPTLTRSHTSSLLKTEGDSCHCQSMLLSKQISDECIVPKSWRSLDCSLAHGQHRVHPFASGGCRCSSSCSLESAFSSASETSITFASSPPASPSHQRRSLPCELTPAPVPSPSQPPQELPDRREPTLQRRSKSLRYAVTQNRVALRRGGSSRLARDKKTSLQTSALPEDTELLCRPLALSSSQVFQQVDSRIPSPPPSYREATQSSPPACHSMMTVQEAWRQKNPRLDAHPADQSHTLHNDIVASDVTNGPDGASPAVRVAVCRTRSISESVYQAPAKRVVRRCSQPVFEELIHARESYV